MGSVTMDNEFIKSRSAIADGKKKTEKSPERKNCAGAVIAKIVRVLTLPTLLFFALILTLYCVRREAFATTASVLVPILGIGVFPLLS